MSPGHDVAEHPARILIVDDDRHNRQLLELMLAPEGFSLQTAASGEEALALVAQEAPDLILLDILMPGMDGYQVAGTIKGNPVTKNIPVIMVTALDDRDARMLGLRAGAEDFISQPVDRAELCVRVKNLLRLKAYSDDHDRYSQLLETEVLSRTADLRLERDRAQRYLDTAQVILLKLDREGRIQLLNRYGCTLLGWEADELLGRDWVETCLPARARDAFGQRFHDLVGGDLSIVENPVLTKAGEERLIEWRNTLLRDDAGYVIGTFSSGTDITERHQAVEALRAAEERMRFALESANVGIWDMDYTTGTLRWSETMEAHYGVKPGKFAGTFDAFIERVHPDDRESVHGAVGKAVIGGADFTRENRSVWPDGTVRWLTGAGRIYLGEHGKPVRGVGISLDVTERRTLEKQYQQAQKMEAVGRLAGGVAHDFNNLLSVILGWTEMALTDLSADHPVRESLEEVIKAGEGAASLTKQLLAFSRQQVVETTLFNPNDLVVAMDKMLQRLIGEDVELVTRTDPSLGRVKMDRGQLDQVLMNLVVNARDAMPTGGKLTIETMNVVLDNAYPLQSADLTPGKYVMLAVSDTGTGMSEEVKAKIFEPFFTTKERDKGTGLGLATSYGIVKQAGGHIAVYSEPGIGTTFKVYLPLRREATAPAGHRRITPPHGVETILLVEDEPAVRRVTTAMLEAQGYRVISVGSGKEALRVIEGGCEPLQLLLTDVVLAGGMSGRVLAERVHARCPDLKVMFASGYTNDVTILHGMLEAGVTLVQKPFTAETLGRKVREVLDAPAVATPVAAR